MVVMSNLIKLTNILQVISAIGMSLKGQILINSDIILWKFRLIELKVIFDSLSDKLHNSCKLSTVKLGTKFGGRHDEIIRMGCLPLSLSITFITILPSNAFPKTC